MKPVVWSAAFALGLVMPAHAATELPRLFADGAVLQRDQPMPVWGWSTPGAKISVGFDGQRARATAGKDGAWRVVLPAHKAGGPYRLTVHGDGGISIDDVLVGDVWLASGQSNMEWPLAQSDRGAQEIAAANDPQLRHFKVPKSWALQPQRQLSGGAWKTATPQDAGAFSAVGYFFAKELRQSTGVPIGIVDSTWGGSSIEAWMDAASQQINATRMAEQLAAQQARDTALLDATRRRLARWPQGGAEGQGDAWAAAAAALDDGDWDSIPVPGLWEENGYAGMDGIAWYRVSFTLDKAETGKDLSLGVGRIDDGDVTWVNGQEVGRTPGRYNEARVYRVPAAALKAGVNHVAIRVSDSGGGGGIHGDPRELFVQPGGARPRAFDGAWKFRPAQVSLSADADKNQQPTLLYNAMIRPLQPFPVKGVIWYQGESNAGSVESALRYRQQFPSMIQAWRTERDAPQLPFLWVQLANFRSGADRGDASPWAVLRESQSRTLTLPATAQAVIIDVGNPGDIHPTNKHDVGHRLALGARHVAYGETLTYRAPVFDRATFGDGGARLRFTLDGDALAVRGGGGLRGFSVAGADHVFHPAQARIDGDSVIVRSDAVATPVAARYGWSENPADANLINREGLPVSPFRTDDF